ncbi:MAG: DUF11 domain-containing protein [Eudoraea sp.]|nr:DUF11 domain-containing protein [Eudoraea sp.]
MIENQDFALLFMEKDLITNITSNFLRFLSAKALCCVGFFLLFGILGHGQIIGISNETVAEDVVGGNLVFTVTLDVPNPLGTSVTYSFTNVTAINGTDYNGTLGTVTFPPNDDSDLIIVVPITDDGIFEGTESFTITLGTPTGGEFVSGSPATGTITDDDTAPDVTINNASAAEGNSVGFPVTLSNPSSEDITLRFEFADITATSGGDTDYIADDVDVTILAGETTGTINVPTTQDLIDEPDETFTASVKSVQDGTVGDIADTAIGTIIDDDPSPDVTIDDDSANEGNDISFGVTLSGESSGNITLTLGFADGSATGGTDYINTAVQITILAGDTTGVVDISTIEDTTDELDETFVISVLSVDAGMAGDTNDTATGTIIDDDAPPNVTIGNASADEGTSISFPVNLDRASSGNITLTFELTDGTATGGVDYTNTNVQITILAGDTTGTVVVPTTGDSIDEPNENFIVSVFSVDLGSVGNTTDTATGIIIDDDPAPDVTIDDASAIEGNPIGFPVILSGPSSEDITLNFQFTDVTATSGGNTDYTGSDVEITILAGETTGTVVVPTTDDSSDEEDETFTASVESVKAGTVGDTNDTAIGTIIDDDDCDAGTSPPVLNTDIPTIFCDVILQSLNDYVLNAPPSGTTLIWSINPDPLEPSGYLTPAEVNDPTPGTYYGFFYDSLNNCASPTLDITLSVNNTPQITSTTSDIRCGEGEVTLTVDGFIPGSATAPSFAWYASQTSTDALSNLATFTPTISVTTTFWVEATANGCPSEREGVTATVIPSVTAGTPINGSACSVQANGPTTIDLDDQLTGADAGEWNITTDPSGDLTINPNNNVVNFEGRPDGEYIFTFTTTGAVSPCVNESVEVSITVNDCDVDTDGDGLFDGDEAILGTNPLEEDTDGDGIDDFTEAGPDINNPLDEDSDGIIDALDSDNIDSDGDGVNDQQDPGNLNPCVPDNLFALCDSDGDGITDGEEIANGTDPFDPCDPNLTPDCNPDPIDLQIVKISDVEEAAIGQLLVFTITATNLSDRRILEILILDSLPDGFLYDSHTSNLGTYEPISGEWIIDEMQPLEEASLDILVEVQEGTNYTNTATLSKSFPADGNAENNSSSVTIELDIPEGVDLKIEKEAVSARPLVGDEVTFTITVTNQSLEDTVIDIRVEDIVTSEPDDGFVYLGHQTLKGIYSQDTGRWEIPSLAKDEKAILEIIVQVPIPGTYFNTARILSSSPADSDLSNNSSTAEIQVNERTIADCGFFFNQFSPNGDGTNDRLSINCLELYPNNSIEIFNRYGNLVFEAQNMTPDSTWDGTRKNKAVPDGTYFYILDLGDGSEIQKGWIQIIR